LPWRGEYFVASDIPALLQHTREMFFLADGDIAVLTAKGVHVMDTTAAPSNARAPRRLGPHHGGKGRLQAFMQKEIFRAAARGARYLARPHFAGHRKSLSGRNGDYGKQFREFQQVRIVACGTELARRAGRKIHD